MTRLADIVRVEHRSARSVNLEQELLSASPLAGFVVGEQVLDGVRRLLAACEPAPVTRAWSITGPYGAGKSSFAHFACALFGAADEPAEAAARGLLENEDHALAERLADARNRLGAARRGFVLAVSTAEREPAVSTLARALHHGADLYWGGRRGRRPDVLHRLQAATVGIQSGEHPDPHFVLTALEDLIAVAPVMLVVDELGKALEYAAGTSREGDLYVLQQIAERFSSTEVMAGCFVALQHQAFEDYATGLSPTRRREWRKIQGRFEDVAFTGGSSHGANLIGGSLRLEAPPRSVATAMRRATRELLRVAPEVKPVLDALGTVPAGYPLHPTVVPALSELAGRFGQHDRSIMAFLTSDAPDALPAFVRQTTVGKQPPFLRLPEVYDYFVDGAASLATVGEEAAKLREIRGRVSEAASTLTVLELRCLKSIGVLNLVADGAFRASDPLISQAICGPEGTDGDAGATTAALRTLRSRGLVTYRDFAGEYRVWQGSDFDVVGEIAERREQLAADVAVQGPPIREIEKALPPRSMVARRHSQRVEMLRYFEVLYEAKVPREPPACSSADSDGLLLYVFAQSDASALPPAATADGRPLLVVHTIHLPEVLDAVLDAAASQHLLEATEDLQDVVARAEIRHRAALSQAVLTERVEAIVDPARTGVDCYAGSTRVPISTRRQLSEILSRLCDETYSRSPVIKNEMLNRRELTSQGAKTRRELIERMFADGSTAGLGISGFGPDRAMYESVLAASGLHCERDGRLTFGPPQKDSGLAPGWDAINAFLDAANDAPATVADLYAYLMAPPYGMKEGPIPILLAAALLHRADDIFVFEDGSFLPRLGPEHFERLVKTPDRFAVKRASRLGVQAGVFRGLQDLVGPQAAPLPTGVRNQTTLAVVRPLISLLHALPDYSRKTKTVSRTAQRVRAALAMTAEPDELLFSALPQACDEPPIGDDSRRGDEFVPALKAALDELAGAYDQLLERIGNALRSAFDTRGPRHALREELRTRARHLVDHVIDRRLRSFLLVASGEELEDREWLEAVATVLAQKPPASWIDADLAVFESATIEVAQPFRRLELLHLQMAAVQQEGFTARRLTLTEADGTEASQLIWLEESRASALEHVLDQALAEASAIAGSEAAEGMLALLAQRVVGEQKEGEPREDPFNVPREAASA